MINIKSIEKEKKKDDVSLGQDLLEKTSEMMKKRHFKKGLKYLCNAIEFYRNALAKKQYCKESRKGLLECYDYFALSTGQIPLNDYQPMIKSILVKEKALPSLKIALIDTFLEKEWEKQAIGKYGGEKPAHLSWKKYYLELEKNNELFTNLNKKITWAIEKGHINLLQQIVVENNDINFNELWIQPDINALNYSIIKNDLNMVMFLLENGVDILATDSKKRTALHYAVFVGNSDICQVIIDAGAKIESKDKTLVTPFILAAIHNKTEIIQLLIEKKININHIDSLGKSALSYVIFSNDLAMAELLLKKGADINITDHYGRTLLHWACTIGKSRIVSLLIDHHIDIDKQDSLGRTALHYASQFNVVHCIKVLLQNNANTTIEDRYNETPLLFAAFCGNKEATSSLYEYTGPMS